MTSKLRKEKERIIDRLENSILPILVANGSHDADDCVIEICCDEGYLLDGGDYADSLIVEWTNRHPDWLEFLIKQTFMRRYGRGIVKGIDDTTRGIVKGIRSAGYEL